MAARVTWEVEKARANRRKHGVSFEEALTVFADPLARIHDDPVHSAAEECEIFIEHSERGRMLLVSFCERRGTVRLISARRATRHEREDYEKGARP